MNVTTSASVRLTDPSGYGCHDHAFEPGAFGVCRRCGGEAKDVVDGSPTFSKNPGFKRR